MSFLDLLRPPKKGGKSSSAPSPVTSDDLRTALNEAETALAEAEREAASVAEERHNKLLLATEAELDEVDGRLRLAQRAADRTTAAVTALEARLRETLAAEDQAERDALYTRGGDALARALALYEAYSPAAAQIAAICAELASLSAAVEDANKQLSQRGDARLVADIDTTARPRVSALAQLRHPLWLQVRLPHPSRPHDMLHPHSAETVIPEPEYRPLWLPGSEPPAPPRKPGHWYWP